jgi:hypothetical protein
VVLPASLAVDGVCAGRGGVLVLSAVDSAAVRRSTRRRWEPLKAWESERVVYTEEGALRAEKAGVLTPDLEDNRRKVRTPPCVLCCVSACCIRVSSERRCRVLLTALLPATTRCDVCSVRTVRRPRAAGRLPVASRRRRLPMTATMASRQLRWRRCRPCQASRSPLTPRSSTSLLARRARCESVRRHVRDCGRVVVDSFFPLP